MVDICSLFGFSDVRVFGYYLFRQRNVDGNTGEYALEDNHDISYDLDNASFNFNLSSSVLFSVLYSYEFQYVSNSDITFW